MLPTVYWSWKGWVVVVGELVGVQVGKGQAEHGETRREKGGRKTDFPGFSGY